MARQPIRVRIQLVDLECIDEADGLGNAEPYLWPVFFTIDGGSYSVDAGGAGLIGHPVVDSARAGGHGNLGDAPVGAGDIVPIPAVVGRFETILRPIPVNDPDYASALGAPDLPGTIGVAVVLMEQDGWDDATARAGYRAFATAVELGIARAMATFQHHALPPSKDDIAARVARIRDEAGAIVRGALLEHMSAAQLAWYGTVGNNDDRIGSEVWMVGQDELEHAPTLSVRRRWDAAETEGNGEWSMTLAAARLDALRSGLERCTAIAESIESLAQDLEEDLSPAERQRIHRAIADLRREWAVLGCPQPP